MKEWISVYRWWLVEVIIVLVLITLIVVDAAKK